MASVVLSGWLSLINRTISAFCFGLTRHASTTSTSSAMSKNVFFKLSSASIVTSEAPAMMSAYLRLCSSSSTEFFFNFLTASNNSSINLDLSVSSAWCQSLFSVSKRPADTPMFIAVSILSPVSTQTLTPAFLANWIVSGTLSYSLSSMAVDPSSVKLVSILASTAATFSSLSESESLAF